MRKLEKYFTPAVLLITLLMVNISAQDSLTCEEDNLKNIYESLEYNTMAFDDLKDHWIVSDPLLVREVYNKMIVANAIRVNNEKITVDSLARISKPIFNGEALIVARKRYYDNEIELFKFVTADQIDRDAPEALFDPITDGFYLRQILGNELYSKIQDRIYFFRNVTKDDHNTETGYYFDINLNGLEPELMFWNTTSQERNKYLVSAFGKWGNDRIYLPGWFFSEFAIGGKLSYYKQLGDDESDYTYAISLGTVVSTSKPYKNDLPVKPLKSSGRSVYFKFSGDPARVIFDNFRQLYFDFEMMLTLNEYKNSEFGTMGPLDFYSVRNYYVFSVKKKNILNLFDFGNLEAGAGYSAHNIFHYEIIPGNVNLVDLNDAAAPESPFDHHIFADIGVSKSGGLLQHEIELSYGYNLVRDINYIGIKAKIMLSETFGFDVRYYSAVNTDKTAMPWRTDSYFVFSPVLRINY